MKKWLALIVVLAPLWALGGCGIVSLNTNIPFGSLFGAETLEVVNSGTYEIALTVNGDPLALEESDGRSRGYLRPGESTKIRYIRTMVLTAKAYDHGQFVGVAVHKRYAYGHSYGYGSYGYYQPDANVWVIRDQDIGNTGGTGSGFFSW